MIFLPELSILMTWALAAPEAGYRSDTVLLALENHTVDDTSVGRSGGTATDALAAVVEPAVFDAVTLHASPSPVSAACSVYDVLVAPVMSAPSRHHE
jgi:hypothetical protein